MSENDLWGLTFREVGIGVCGLAVVYLIILLAFLL